MNEVLDDVTAATKKIKVPSGYSVALTGEREEMRESFQSLAFALTLSVVLVYMVMASELESLWQPLLIMATIPMSLIGVAIGLHVTHTPISVMVGLGLIILGGVVVDNGIVLVEFINELRREGMALEEAVVEASRIRLRPILLTAGTTVLGLLPLTLGLQQGAELQIPMGTTLIWGLSVSTFLTLVYLPTVYVAGAHFFERFSPVKVHAHSLEPVPSLELAGIPAGVVAPLLPLVSPDFPEIPENYGGEDAVVEKSDFPLLLPEQAPPPESEPSPEPPAGPPPTLAEPVFETSDKPEEPPVASEPPAVSIGSARTEETIPNPSPFNPRQEKLLEYLKTHGKISRKEYVELTGASVPTAARDLKELVDQGRIRGIGPLARGRYYVLA